MNEWYQTYECVMPHIYESCHKYEWIMPETSVLISSIWMSHVSRMNESRITYEWVTYHVWMSHIPHMNESRITYEWVISHIWMSHLTRMNESCHTYEWVLPFIRVTRINESCHTYEGVMSHTWMSHVTLNESRHTIHNAYAMIFRIYSLIGLFCKRDL